MPPAPPDLCLDVLREMRGSLGAIVDEVDDAAEERTRFGQESRDAHAMTAAAVARCEATIDTLTQQLTQARVESAGAIAAAEAGVKAVQDANTVLVRLIYAGAAALLGLTAVLLWGALAVRGIDADAAFAAGRKFASPTAVDRGTTPEGASNDGT